MPRFIALIWEWRLQSGSGDLLIGSFFLFFYNVSLFCFLREETFLFDCGVSSFKRSNLIFSDLPGW